jgi:hypothetical protein
MANNLIHRRDFYKMNKNYKNNNKKGLSTLIVTVILIALSLVAVGLLWGFVSNIVNGQIKNSEACYGNYDKVKLNTPYICYETSDNVNYKVRVSLSIGDVNIDKVLVSISSKGSSNSYTISNTAQAINGLANYPSATTQIKLPDKNAALTYIATGFSAPVDYIRIAPVIGGVQCEMSDSTNEIPNCVLLT